MSIEIKLHRIIRQFNTSKAMNITGFPIEKLQVTSKRTKQRKNEFIIKSNITYRTTIQG